jgi:hypothetical protein
MLILREISGSHGDVYEDDSSKMLLHVVWQKMINLSDVLTTFTIRAMMEAIITSETSISVH